LIELSSLFKRALVPDFLTLADAREKMEDWRNYYNEERPQGAIGQKAPITLLNHGGAASPPT
jgi:putative transposase